VLASLVEYCAQADVIGLDLLLPEQDYVFASGDDHLADVVRTHGRVVAAAFVAESRQPQPPPPAARPAAPLGLDVRAFSIPSRNSALLPYPALLGAVTALGTTTQAVDPDGTVRRYSVGELCQGSTYPSFAVALALAVLGNDGQALVSGPGRRLRLGPGRPVALDSKGQFRLNPALRYHRTVSAADVLLAAKDELEGRIPSVRRDAFRGKVVIVAATATGVQKDHVPTSVAPAMAGVYVHATALDNLLGGNALLALPGWSSLLLALLLVVPLSPVPAQRPLGVLSVHLGLAVLYFGLAVLALGLARIVLPTAPPLLALLGCGVATGLRSWRQELRQHQALERLDAAKQRFTDMLVHDLRNHVAPLTLVLDALQERLSPADSASQGLLTTGRSCSRRLLVEVQSLLDIRRMSEGRLRLSPERLCVEEFLDRSLPLYEPAFADRQRPLRRVHGPPDLAAWADPEIAGRILGNLLWNALDHGSAGTEIEIGCEGRGGQVALWVANRGHVIAEKDREAAFEAYVSSAVTGGKRISGAGLGLAFCKLAVEAHGGAIGITSPWPPHADGVQVTLRLPVAREAAGAGLPGR